MDKVANTSNVTLSTATEYAKVKYDEEQELLLMGSLHAPAFVVQEKQRKPIDLVAVVDVSGSMSQRLPLVKESLEFMISQLAPQDRFALVSYHTSVKLELALCEMNKDNKVIAERAVAALKTQGCTNLSGGLILGIEQMIARQTKTEVASVLLFTDGQANEGIKDKVTLVTAMKEALNRVGAACCVFSFGYGSDHDEKLLRAIADDGEGMYYFLEKTDDIPNSFADALGGLLSVVGQNVQIKINALAGISISKIWTKYPQTTNADGSVSVKLSDLYGEERRDIVCRVKVPKLDKPTDKQDLVSFQLDYFNVLTSQILTDTIVASVCRPDQCDAQVADFFLDRERNRLVTAEAMIEARKIADAGKYEEAKELLRKTISTLRASVSAEDSQTKEFIQDLTEAITDMENKQTYSQAGAKKMAWKEQKMTKQRAAGGVTSMETHNKMKMKQAYMDSKMSKLAPTPDFTTPSAPQPSSTLDPALRRTLLIGNTHTPIPEDAAEESKVTPGQKLTHDWTLYVRGADLSFVDKVVFTIHHTFDPSVITVVNAPFEIRRKGWGFFNCRVVIHYKPDSGAPSTPTEVLHQLSFEGNGSSQEIVINLTK